MKKYIAGLITGLILTTTTFAFGTPNTIKLIVNNQEIHSDVPPQIINGRVMVPARFIAEPLGAKVDWDKERNAVMVIGSTRLPQSQQISNEDIDNWISIRQIHDQGLADVTLDSNNNIFYIRNGNVEIAFSSDISTVSEGQVVSISASGAGVSSISVLRYQGRAHLNIDQIRHIGILD